MVRPISNDLRKRAVAAVAKGESCRAVAVRFGVAVSSVVKWSQRYRATGSVAPGKMGGHRKPILEPHRAFIKEISQTPHLTLHALKDELAARGVKVSHNAVWLFLRREGLRFKKTLLALEQARSDIARRRQPCRSWQAKLDPRRLVFIDETWIKTNMAPLRGWGPKRRAGAEFRAARSLADVDVPWRLALRPPHCTLPIRRSNQRRMLPRLCSAGSRPAASAGRYRSKPPAPGSGTCRHTPPTSIQSNRPSPRSSTACTPPRSAPLTTFVAISADSSQPSSPTNAATTSKTPDTLLLNRETL
ncbi:transposase [Bradyrhizobium japonicum]